MAQNILDDNARRVLELSFDFVARQCRRIVEAYPDFHPMYTTGGRWKHEGESWTHWCEGFFPGMLWLIHERTGDPWFRATAERYTSRLEPRKLDRNVHDLGFIFLNTYLRWRRLTNDQALNQVVIDAGKTLALRFQPKGKYLASFIGPSSLFIDIMMNVPIIYYAARETNDASLRQVADDHCATTAQRLVHADGSTVHEGIFDTENGAFIRESTHQGLGPSTCWSRGLAWALYGYGTVYSYTGDQSHLELAERIAGYYLNHTPGGAVPPWDFDGKAASDDPGLFDSSAGAIAASGLWNLATLTRDETRRTTYRKHAIDTLLRLSSDDFLAEGRPEQEGILLHGVYHRNKGLGVDESVIWGDHFYVEALTKILAAAADQF